MIRRTSRIVLLSWLLLIAGCSDLPASPVGPVGTPVITEPVCGAVMRWPEQPMKLAWRPVDSARSYTVELDCLNCGTRRDPWASQSGTPWMIIPNLEHSQYAIDIAATVRQEGGRALRWRVWATDRQGSDGMKTDWCLTSFSDSGLPVPGVRKP